MRTLNQLFEMKHEACVGKDGDDSDDFTYDIYITVRCWIAKTKERLRKHFSNIFLNFNQNSKKY